MTETTGTTEDIVERASKARRRVIILDYDGTLVPYAAQPADAQPDMELLLLLERLSKSVDELWIASGRARKDLEGFFVKRRAAPTDGGPRIPSASLEGDPVAPAIDELWPVSLGAEHGAWVRPRGQPWRRLIEEMKPPDAVLPVMTALVGRFPGSRIEAKEFSYAWHYRQASPRPTDAELSQIEAELLRIAEGNGCTLLNAVLAFEVRPRGAQKGLVVEELARRGALDDAFVLLAGDDFTDADLFAAAPPGAACIAVGDRIRSATHRVATPRSLRAVLARLAPPAAP